MAVVVPGGAATRKAEAAQHHDVRARFLGRRSGHKSGGGCCGRDNGNASPRRRGGGGAGPCGVIRLVRSDVGSWGRGRRAEGPVGVDEARSTPPVMLHSATSLQQPSHLLGCCFLFLLTLVCSLFYDASATHAQPRHCSPAVSYSCLLMFVMSLYLIGASRLLPPCYPQRCPQRIF